MYFQFIIDRKTIEKLIQVDLPSRRKRKRQNIWQIEVNYNFSAMKLMNPMIMYNHVNLI